MLPLTGPCAHRRGELVEEKRIPAGGRPALRHHGRVLSDIGQDGHKQLSDPGDRELGGAQTPIGLQEQPRDQLGLRRGVTGTNGPDDGDPQVGKPLGEVEQEPEREVVGPLQIVGDEDQMRLIGQVRHEPVQTVDQVELISERRFVRCRRESEERSGQRRVPPDQRLALGLRRAHGPRLEQAPDEAEGKLPLQLPAAGGKDLGALLGSDDPGRGKQPGLADAAGTFDNEQPAIGATAPLDRVFDRVDLRTTFDKRNVVYPLSRPSPDQSRRPVVVLRVSASSPVCLHCGGSGIRTSRRPVSPGAPPGVESPPLTRLDATYMGRVGATTILALPSS